MNEIVGVIIPSRRVAFIVVAVVDVGLWVGKVGGWFDGGCGIEAIWKVGGIDHGLGAFRVLKKELWIIESGGLGSIDEFCPEPVYKRQCCRMKL